VSLGTYARKSDAERAYAIALADQLRGLWVDPRQGRLTLDEYAPTWIAARLTATGEPLRPRVRELYESQLRLHILPVLGRLELGRLSTATVRSWHSGLLASGVGTSTVAKCYRLLRAMLATAVEDGFIAVNPCTIKGAGAERAAERPIISAAQAWALADAVEPRYRALVLLAAFGGLRRGELFALTRAHLDLLHSTVTVRVQRQQLKSGDWVTGPPKTEAGVRTFVLPAELLPVLTDHLGAWVASTPDALVFTGAKGGPLRQHVWHAQWDKARRAVGLPGLHFHDLRHVAGTLAASTGVGTKELMHRLGHASPRAALLYQHATAERDTAIANAMSDLIRRARLEPPLPPVVPIDRASHGGRS
jgi:integrase